MAWENAFREAVAAGDLRLVRIMMEDSLLLDLTFQTFREMESAASSLPGLYEPHDGRELKFDKEAWNDDYMNDLMVQVISNFSHERVQHLQDVVRYLRPAPEPVRRPAPEPAHHPAPKPVRRPEHTSASYSAGHQSLSYEEQKRRDQQNGTYLGTKKIVAGAVTGAAAGVVVAKIASVAAAGIVGAAAVGAVVGGFAAYALDSKER
jgi:hypothetical protein